MASTVVATRPVTSEDASLLYEVFVTGEAAAWTAMLPNVDNGPVLQRMFAGRQAEYSSQFPEAQHHVIVIDGEPAGQVRWAERDADVQIVDIGLLPSYRRRGAAAAVYTRLIEHARRVRKPVRSTVTKLNEPSVALHHRLGFRVESENDTHYFLVTR
jgi:RimJ/RimL family protein N-acetyltransferase